MHVPYTHLTDVIDVDTAPALSHRGTAGFQSRLLQGNLGRYPGFRDDVEEHVAKTRHLTQLALRV